MLLSLSRLPIGERNYTTIGERRLRAQPIGEDFRFRELLWFPDGCIILFTQGCIDLGLQASLLGAYHRRRAHSWKEQNIFSHPQLQIKPGIQQTVRRQNTACLAIRNQSAPANKVLIPGPKYPGMGDHRQTNIGSYALQQEVKVPI